MKAKEVVQDKTAILIVNGGKDPEQGKWIQLCLSKILEHTKWENYHIYVWNNNVEDELVKEYLTQSRYVTLMQANPEEHLSHIHATPLQRLYELARKDKAKYIVAMDSDAHPIKALIGCASLSIATIYFALSFLANS